MKRVAVMIRLAVMGVLRVAGRSNYPERVIKLWFVQQASFTALSPPPVSS